MQRNIYWNLYLATVRLAQLIQSVILWQPYYVSKFHHPRIARLISKLTKTEHYNIVQSQYTQMAEYVKHTDSGKTVLHEIDVSNRPAYRSSRKTNSIFLKAFAYIEWCRWYLYEKNIGRRFHASLRCLTYSFCPHCGRVCR